MPSWSWEYPFPPPDAPAFPNAFPPINCCIFEFEADKGDARCSRIDIGDGDCNRGEFWRGWCGWSGFGGDNIWLCPLRLKKKNISGYILYVQYQIKVFHKNKKYYMKKF